MAHSGLCRSLPATHVVQRGLNLNGKHDQRPSLETPVFVRNRDSINCKVYGHVLQNLLKSSSKNVTPHHIWTGQGVTCAFAMYMRRGGLRVN